MEQQYTQKTPAKDNPFMIYNHMQVGKTVPDQAEVYLDVRQESLNRYGVVHGGAFFTMADCCAGLCARSDGRAYVTQGATVQFIGNLSQGRVVARGRVFSRKRRICLVDVAVTEEAGAELFHGTFTMYCVNPGDAAAKQKGAVYNEA